MHYFCLFLFIKFFLSASQKKTQGIFDYIFNSKSNSDTSPLVKVERPPCDISIVQSYGLIGTITPIDESFHMCPGLRQSCCMIRDQFMIYNNWIHMKEKKQISSHLQKALLIYQDFLTNLEIAQKTIKEHYQSREHYYTNCSLIQKRILYFEIDKVKVHIQKHIANMNEFFETAYQGFYCSICDTKMHKYIWLDQNSLQMSQLFCWEIVEKTLPILLFFYKNVIQHYLLIYKYLASCNQQGLYDFQTNLDSKFLLFQDDQLIPKLELCRKYVNTEIWHVYCKFICEKFQMTSVSDFFLPQIQEIQYGIIMLMTYTNAFKEQKTVDLDKIDFKKHEVILKYKNFYRNMKTGFFNNGLIKKIDLGVLNVNVSEQGLTMYSHGVNSLITDESYEQMKLLGNYLNGK